MQCIKHGSSNKNVGDGHKGFLFPNSSHSFEGTFTPCKFTITLYDVRIIKLVRVWISWVSQRIVAHLCLSERTLRNLRRVGEVKKAIGAEYQPLLRHLTPTRSQREKERRKGVSSE